MGDKFYGKRASRKEMKGKLIDTEGLAVGDIIIGGVSRDYYQIIKIVKQDIIKVINLSVGNNEPRNAYLRGGVHYEWSDLCGNELKNAENW